jgi:hypothetical protein
LLYNKTNLLTSNALIMYSQIKTSLLFLFFLTIISCQNKLKPTNALTFTVDGKTFNKDVITPEPFPKVNIPGFVFPEDSTVINGWISAGNNEAIYQHGWGLWAGLTSKTNPLQTVGGNDLLVFETWLTPSEIIDSIKGNPIHRSGRNNLNIPSQFTHAARLGNKEEPDLSDAESVSYSPGAADFAIKNKIFMLTTLQNYTLEGKTSIPDFPTDAITIKPVFKVIQKSKLDSKGLYAMPSWHGPIQTVNAFPEIAWKSCIYVDTNNKGGGDGSQDMTCSGATPATTYNLNDFIHYKLNEEDAYFYNKEFDLNAVAGDIAILVAMHVTTRETKRWTWQSFWWAPDPNNPPAPSSAAIAKQRPMAGLQGAASHYAMTVAYSMVSPEQPYTGGQSVGDTVIGFNPYLEARFGPGVFVGSQSYVIKNGQKIMTNAGVRTNCMSCHAYASLNTLRFPKDTITGPYSGDAYVSLTDTIFNNKLKLDFAWSIAGNIDTTGIAKFLAKVK